MAINSTDTKIKTSGDGATLTFSFPFKIFQNTDIVVQKIDKDTDVATTLTLGTDYTVSINTVTEGGTITIDAGETPSADEWVFIYSNLPFTQTVVLPTDGAFREISVSNGMDRLCRLIQQVKERADRAVVQRADVTAVDIIIPEPESLKLLGWNEAGTSLENKVPVDADVVTAAQEALEQAEEAQAAAEEARDAAEEARDAAEVVAGWEVASQAEAETGADNIKVMTPLRVKQSVLANEQHLIVNDTKPNNTAGGTFTSGAWRTRDLNTEVYNTISGALLGAAGDVLLLHMDGSDSGTTFTDAYSRHTITAQADAQTKTAVKKFGTASAYFDGTGDYLTIPNSEDFNFGTADFTIDMWVRFAEFSSGAYGLFSTSGVYTDGITIVASATGSSLSVYFEGADKTFAWSPVVDTWYHVALTRSGTSVKAFIDGTQIGSEQTVSTEIHTSNNVSIGGYYGSTLKYFNGYIDELRISKGVARWTENFTPEVVAYDADDEYTLNAINLPAGTYLINASAPGHNITQHKAKLYNVTDSEDTLIGCVHYQNNHMSRAIIQGAFTITGAKVFEIRHYCSNTVATQGFGYEYNIGVPEIYTTAHITKIA
ncbi:MAG: hypothetical protein M0P69_01515 [Bacteroidales bacterium]|nr:hypothetical protein [Bacteroidales bacterium]